MKPLDDRIAIVLGRLRRTECPGWSLPQHLCPTGTIEMEGRFARESFTGSVIPSRFVELAAVVVVAQKSLLDRSASLARM